MTTRFDTSDMDPIVKHARTSRRIHRDMMADAIATAYPDPAERMIILTVYDRELTALYRALSAVGDLQLKILNDASCADPGAVDAVNDLLGPLGL